MTLYGGEPGALKFLYYYMMQGWNVSKKDQVHTLKHLTQLSHHELMTIIDTLKLNPADLNLNLDATLIELRELKEPLEGSLKALEAK